MRGNGSEFPVELAHHVERSAAATVLFTAYIRDITEPPPRRVRTCCARRAPP